MGKRSAFLLPTVFSFCNLLNDCIIFAFSLHRKSKRLMQETNVYFYLTPLALIFIVLEIVLCFVYRRDYITFPEAVANFGTALGNQTTNVLVAAGVFVIYGFLWENYRLFTIEMNWWSFVL